MPRSSYGAGTIFKRGEIWYVSLWADGRQVQKSSGSRGRQDAVRLRDQLLGRKARGEVGEVALAKVTCGELLDDLLEYGRSNIKPSTAHLETGDRGEHQTVLRTPQGGETHNREAEGIPA